MGIATHEVAQAVRHEDCPQVHLHHLIYVTFEQSMTGKLLKENTLCQTVHVRPENT